MSEARLHAETLAEWRAWLAEHHTRSEGIWLVSWKAHTGRPRMSYDDAVTEALAYGWIDSKPRKLDERRTMLWFSPRRAGSAWSRLNKQRIQRLEAEGRMQPAGRRAVERATADGSWNALDEVEDLVVPDDLAAALAQRPPAPANWAAFPRSARRGILEWIVQAKTPQTRSRRVTETAEKAAFGERANQWQRR